jgi:NAD-dependent DNA ligase
MLNENGRQDLCQFSEKRLSDRAVDELIGLSRGLIADGGVNQQEAEFLSSWIKANKRHCNDPVVNTLFCRVKDMLSDGVLDDEEQKELLQLLAEFTGESIGDESPTGRLLAATLPLCSPQPEVIFQDHVFCLTGTFAFGPRTICKEVVAERGGKVSGAMTGRVDYLVVGTLCSPSWMHTSYGRKIERAAELRASGLQIHIISEDTWASAAFRGAGV